MMIIYVNDDEDHYERSSHCNLVIRLEIYDDDGGGGDDDDGDYDGMRPFYLRPFYLPPLLPTSGR